MNIICLDNGGETADRYTVVYLDDYDARRDVYQCVGMSADPYHPQGFGQHSECDKGWAHESDDQRIEFENLPEPCQHLVLSDLDMMAADTASR